MQFEEFKNIVMAIKEAYPNSNSMTTEEGINLWYEMLKDLEYDMVTKAVFKHMQGSRFAPSIAEIRQKSVREQYTPWMTEWMKLLNNARVDELNEPGQYAFRLITRNCFESCLANPDKLMQCMKTFEGLYDGYYSLSEQDKEEFKAIAVPQYTLQIACEDDEVGDDW